MGEILATQVLTALSASRGPVAPRHLAYLVYGDNWTDSDVKRIRSCLRRLKDAGFAHLDLTQHTPGCHNGTGWVDTATRDALIARQQLGNRASRLIVALEEKYPITGFYRVQDSLVRTFRALVVQVDDLRAEIAALRERLDEADETRRQDDLIAYERSHQEV